MFSAIKGPLNRCCDKCADVCKQNASKYRPLTKGLMLANEWCKIFKIQELSNSILGTVVKVDAILSLGTLKEKLISPLINWRENIKQNAANKNWINLSKTIGGMIGQVKDTLVLMKAAKVSVPKPVEKLVKQTKAVSDLTDGALNLILQRSKGRKHMFRSCCSLVGGAAALALNVSPASTHLKIASIAAGTFLYGMGVYDNMKSRVKAA